MKLVEKARIQLICSQPFFASMLLRLNVFEDNTIPTACTNGKEIRYNSEFFNSLTMKQVIFILCHELYHVIFLHHTRRGLRNPRKWNIACDYAINPMLVEAGFEMPVGGLLKDEYKGKSAEEIFSLLPEDSGEDSQSSSIGDVEDFPSDSQAEISQHESKVKQDIVQAVNMAKKLSKGAGTIPDSIERLVGDILNPTIPWRDVLSRFFTERVNNDYSWSQPNKRYLNQGLYLPYLDGQQLGNGKLIMDTSGSTWGMLELFFAEILDIIREFNTPLDLIYADNEVKEDSCQTIYPDDEASILKPTGCGGTDFIPAFEYINSLDEQPSFVVYYTDGECSSFPEEPDYSVLWACTDKNFKPPFGEVVVIQENFE